MRSASREKFDAVIVGAGPAGSAAAILLARGGWHVALVERQEFPRRKVCGECLAASNLPLLRRLGIGAALDVCAGPELHRVTLLRGDRSVTADLPAADSYCDRWGRAMGRETLDTLLLEEARAAGATVLQPWSVQAILGTPGDWRCEVRALESAGLRSLRASVLIDAHGSWEDSPWDRPLRRLQRGAGDLLAFKANFRGSALSGGAIYVLALDGGYGGMVIADSGTTTVACCVRRDRLSEVRAAAPGLRAGEAVEAWLQRECGGVRQALRDATRDGPWLASGPLATGVRIGANDKVFRIGNAAGEAHPILGEGMSMALQSAAMLCSHLLAHQPAEEVPPAIQQAELQRRYAAGWRREFVPRLRLAAAFAHVAMRPHAAETSMTVVRHWPGLLTNGARWGGKVRVVERAAAHDRKRGGAFGPAAIDPRVS